MKNVFTLIVFSLCLAIFPIKKSEAVVGLLLANPAITAVGGIMTFGSVGSTYIMSYIEHKMGRGPRGAISEKSVAFLMTTMAVGIVVLDGTDKAEIVFTSVDESSQLYSKNFSASDIAIYNSELAELNAVRESVTAEIEANPLSNVSALWQENGAALSPQTLMIADFNGKILTASLTK